MVSHSFLCFSFHFKYSYLETQDTSRNKPTSSGGVGHLCCSGGTDLKTWRMKTDWINLHSFSLPCDTFGYILYRCIVCHSVLLHSWSMMMNVSSHFRMTYSPPLQNHPPPSSLLPHQGCRGTQVDETSSTNARRPNPLTQACTSQPRHPTITAKSQDTLPPHPHYTTNEDIPGSHLETTWPSKRKMPQYLPRKNT